MPTPPPLSGFPDSLTPPTKSSAAGFVAAAAGMAVVMSGLLWWKLSDAAPAKAQAVATPPLEPSAQAFEQPPPPPPPPAPAATQDKAPESQPDKPSSAAKGVLSTCAGTCKGTVSGELQSALRAKAGAARSCYERALRQNEMLQGRLTIGVRVSPEGRICSASVVSDSLGDPSVASCVARLMRSGTMPAPSGGCVDVQVPMSFVARN